MKIQLFKGYFDKFVLIAYFISFSIFRGIFNVNTVAVESIEPLLYLLKFRYIILSILFENSWKTISKKKLFDQCREFMFASILT